MYTKITKHLLLLFGCLLITSCGNNKQYPALQTEQLNAESDLSVLNGLPFHEIEGNENGIIKYRIEDERFLRYEKLPVNDLLLTFNVKDKLDEVCIRFFVDETKEVKDMALKLYEQRDQPNQEDESDSYYNEEPEEVTDETTEFSWKKNGISYKYAEPWGFERYAELTITFKNEDNNENTY